MDFVIWALEFCRSTLPHCTHKLMGSGCKPEPAGVYEEVEHDHPKVVIAKIEKIEESINVGVSQLIKLVQ